VDPECATSTALQHHALGSHLVCRILAHRIHHLTTLRTGSKCHFLVFLILCKSPSSRWAVARIALIDGSRSSRTRSKDKKAAQPKDDPASKDPQTATVVGAVASKGAPAKRGAQDIKSDSSLSKAPVKKRASQVSSTTDVASVSATTSSASTIAEPAPPSRNDSKSRKRTAKHKSIESLQLPTPETTPVATTPAPVTAPAPEPEPEVFVPEAQSLPSYATQSATKALQKQLKQIIKTQLATTLGQERYWTLDLSRLDDLYTWYFTLSCFDPDIPLSADMRSYGINSVELEVKFGPQHPNSPPFVRIIKPRFMQWMNGGGGHVTAGGSICVELLTMKGWKKEYTLEQVLLVVHQALSDVEPVPARLIGNYGYTVEEAVSAYIRVANSHGWRVPQNWRTLFTKN